MLLWLAACAAPTLAEMTIESLGVYVEPMEGVTVVDVQITPLQLTRGCPALGGEATATLDGLELELIEAGGRYWSGGSDMQYFCAGPPTWRLELPDEDFLVAEGGMSTLLLEDEGVSYEILMEDLRAPRSLEISEVLPAQELELAALPSMQPWFAPEGDDCWWLDAGEDESHQICPPSVRYEGAKATLDVPALCNDGPGVLLSPARSLQVDCLEMSPPCSGYVSGERYDVSIVFPEGYEPACPG